MAESQEHRREAVGLEEAAERLHLDVDTVRVAVRQGWLDGYHDADGTWKVWLKASAPPETPSPEPEPQPAAGQAEPPRETAAAAESPQAAPERPSAPIESDRLIRFIERREETLARKDEVIGAVARDAMRLAQSAVDRLPPAPAARPEPEVPPAPDRPQQRLLREIADTLRDVREYLSRQEHGG
jgi:hypothetical protein